MAIAIAVALAGCSSSSESASEEASPDTLYANVDLAGTRSASSSIEAGNVSDLEPAWSHPLQGEGVGDGFTGSPVVADGVVYIQDQNSNVLALDLSSGRKVWEKRYEIPARGAGGVILAEGLVFGATPTGAFALDLHSGKEVWSSRLVRDKSETIEMVPGYHRGSVYLSTTPYDVRGGEVGVLWALDAESGRKLWHFDTVPRGLWGNPELNYGGGVIQPPAFDGEGSIYVGTGNPGPIPGTERYPWGSSRPGPNLYAARSSSSTRKPGRSSGTTR